MEATLLTKLEGTGVALVTPFLANGDVDFKGLERLVNHVSKGVQYLVVMGTTAENPTVSQEEQWAILEAIKATKPKEMPLVYGVGGNDTLKTALAVAGIPSGVDAILSVTPYYNKPTQTGLVAHYKTVADAAQAPVILYNVPGRTGINMTADTTLELAGHANIIAIKEANGALEQAIAIAAEKPDDFLLISGDDLLTLPMIACGAKGVISVLANAIPNLFGKMVQHSLNGQYAEARTILHKLPTLNNLMYQEGNPAGIKAALQVLGICSTASRLPVLPASDALLKAIEAELNIVIG